MSVLTIADINTAVSAEPRIMDLRLAEALGFDDKRGIRRLADRHTEALTRFGEVSVTVTETSEKGGRPGQTKWFNLRQALYLATKSEAENAVDLTVEMVDLFAAVREGERVSVSATGTPVIPTLDRADLSMLRLGGKVVLVDTRRYEVGPEDRVVRVHHDGRIDVGFVSTREDGRYGARGYLEKSRKWRKGDPECGRRAIGISGVVQVIGLVIDEIPVGRPALPKPQKDKAKDRSTFDAAAFVDDLVEAGCDVGALTPTPTLGRSQRRPSFIVRPPQGSKTGEVMRSVLKRWAKAIAACPDHQERVAAYLVASSRGAETTRALTRH